MPSGLKGALYGLLIGVIVSLIIILIWRPQAEESYYPPIGESQPHWAYSSFQLYAEHDLGFPKGLFQPYQVGIATYEGSYVWHFRFSIKLKDTAIPMDVHYRSKANNEWEKVTP